MTAVVIGNLDGVHLGHRALIDTAKATGANVQALTFEPHPRQYFAPEKEGFRLSSPEQKIKLLNRFGIDQVHAVGFDDDFAKMTAKEFARDLLVGQLEASHVIIGEDFRFGRGREGTVDILTELGLSLGFQTHIVPTLRDDSGMPYSSTRVRAALSRANFSAATSLLGHPWIFNGTIFKGQQLGRTIGMPTANIELGDYQRIPYGIYALWVGLGDETPARPAVGYIGHRPTVGGEEEWFEAHLFDFDEDIYGVNLNVQPVKFLRGDQKFDGLEPMMAQMQIDLSQARLALGSQ
ncbi:MAG: riboflavin biosynthesis protein RibF [Alphaproteobacteria bacterium]